MTIYKAVRQVEKDAPILVEGAASNHQIFLLLKGIAVVEVKGSVVGTIKAGEWFGELAAILHTPRTATVRAVTPCEVQVYTGPDDDNLYEQVEKDPKLMRKLISQLCLRLQETSQRHAAELSESAATTARYRKAISGSIFALEKLVEKYKSKVMEEVLQHLSSSWVTSGDRADANPSSFPTSRAAIFG
ncbi:MAG TPA: cyclic nucleotide-binding domain-containing protein [Planctomycetota bacterium]|nr:cyclic nucleotide-binding domain-containing protein [Planctomycetota bacterium]